ncbi:MAG: hypothetical protein ACYCW6_16510 [Candidatus Xenobia bacterium]
MIIPRGNILFEGETLNLDDVNVMVSNLEQQGFTGYVRLEADTRNAGLLFFNQGSFVRAMEADESVCTVQPKTRVINKARVGDIPVSVYILSVEMTQVLALAFAFQKLYVNVEAKKKEIKKVRESLEQEDQSGMIEFLSPGGTIYALVDRGKLVYDSFAREYGQIMCGPDQLNKAFETLSKESAATMNVYGEKYAEIDARRRVIEDELEKTRQLIAKVEKTAFGGSDDVVKIDEYILKDWSVKVSSGFQVELETPGGEIVTARCNAGRKVGQYLAISQKLLKRLNVKEGEVINVKPVR